MSWTIYCHTHIESGRRYVGLTKYTMMHRWNQHCAQAKRVKSGRSHFANAVREYGKDAFSHEVLEACDTLEAANTAEERWIEELGTRDLSKGFNLTKGGKHVPHPFKNPWDRPEYRKKMEESVLPKLIAAGISPEAQAKVRDAYRSEELLERCAAAQRGKTMSPAHRAKISENMKAVQLSKSPEELRAQSLSMTAGRHLRRAEMSDSDREIAKARHSRASKSKAVYLRTPEAVSRHREAAARLSHLTPEKAELAGRLRALGFSRGDIGWLLKVSQDVIRYYELRKVG